MSSNCASCFVNSASSLYLCSWLCLAGVAHAVPTISTTACPVPWLANASAFLEGDNERTIFCV
jgi:hypothetical protein